jgi:hypothetical protein
MPEPKRPLKVFLCHARDDKLKTRELYRYLRKRGIQPWLDAEDLVGGEDWRVEIPKAIKASDAIIICLSKNSINKEGFVQAEITFALEKALEIPQGRIFIIPVRFEDCEVPDNLERFHWVDLFEDDGFPKLMKSLKTRAGQLERSTVQVPQPDEASPNLISLSEEKIESQATLEKIDREVVEKISREKKEREAVERAERERKEKEISEKQAREIREKEKKLLAVKPKMGGIQIIYWFGGFAVIVLGIILLSIMKIGQNSIEPPTASQQTQILSLSTPTLENNTLVSPLDITLTPLGTPASLEDVNGFLLYRADGINGLPEYFFADLSSEERYQLTKNDGFSISSEKISNNKKYLAFLFRYGNDDRSKLGVIDLSTETEIQINNQLALVNAARYDWLTDNILIFRDDESSQVGIYNLDDGEITILDSGYYYSASPNGNKVVIWSWKNKNMAVVDISGNLLCEFTFDSAISYVVWSPTSEKFVVATGSDIKLINCEVNEDVLLATGDNAEFSWSPDGQKVAISFVNDGFEVLRTWLKDGQLDESISLDNKDNISFAWGNNSEDYAYIYGMRLNDTYKNTLHINDKVYVVEGSDYPFELIKLPDGNYVFGAYGSGSYIFNVDKKEINQISDDGYYLIDDSNDELVVLELYSETQDSTFIVVDQDGISNLDITERWSWEWLPVEDSFLLVSEQNFIFSNSNKHYPINPSLPVGTTAIAWLPVNLDVNISLLPTASPLIDLGIFTCNIYRLKVDQITLARRTCTCGETVCNCVDYSYGGSHTEWTRDRKGVEEYFSKLGGSCNSP